MEEIYDRIEKYNDDEDVIGAYDYEWHQQELARIRAEKAIKEAHQEGLQEGAKQEKIDTAKNMLNHGMDVNLISEITKLTIEQINELK